MKKWTEKRKQDARERLRDYWTPERKRLAQLRYALRVNKSTLFCNKHGVCIDLSLE